MFEKPPIEIPDAVRELAERNVDQARAAYSQFLDMAHKARDMVSQSQGTLTANALEIQAKAMAFTEQNIDASFQFARELSRARDLQEYAEVQTRYAQKQMQAYMTQAQELGRLMAEAAKPGGKS